MPPSEKQSAGGEAIRTAIKPLVALPHIVDKLADASATPLAKSSIVSYADITKRKGTVAIHPTSPSSPSVTNRSVPAPSSLPMQKVSRLPLLDNVTFNEMFSDIALTDTPPSAASTNVSRPCSTTYLPHLPDHILDTIARGLDEPSLWALMATCRALRSAAEVALRPHLKVCEVRPDPPLCTDIFKPIDPKLARKDKERRAALHKVNRGYASLFAAYPPAAQLLRQLTVEVRSDDKEASWELLSDFAPQLQKLHLHVVDQRWQVSADDDDGESEDASYNHPLDVRDAWPLWLTFPLPMTFDNLTTLSVTSTARTYAHFAQLAEYLPVLRNLSLSAHERDSVVLPHNPSNPDMAPRLPLLARLTVSGNDQNVANILRSITQRSRDIETLILHISNIPSFTNTTMLSIAGDIMSCGCLVQLALYGAMATGLLPMMVRLDLDGGPVFGPIVPDLDDLVVEFDRKMPILHSRPDMPGLRHLTFVDKRADVNGDIIHRPPKLALIDYCDEPDLRAVFKHYPTLKRVQWIIGYPPNPFGKYPKWPRRSIACYVDRPRRDEPLRALRPSLQSKA